MFLSIENDMQILLDNNLDNNQYIIGVDEAGRGPLAGPLVVAGVLFSLDTVIEGIFDSKKLSETKRQILSEQIKLNALSYCIKIVSLEEINRLNIYQASKFGMIECFKEITKQIQSSILLTDAMKISPIELPNVCVIPLIKGDQKSFHIAAASILAKTARDEIMKQLSNEFPCYQWHKNKGYPTKAHRQAIQEYGASIYHRQGFKLI